MSMFSPFGTSLEIEGKSSSSRLFDEESSPFEHTMTLPLSFIDHTTEQMRISLIEESRNKFSARTKSIESRPTAVLNNVPRQYFGNDSKRKTRSVNRQLKERERQRRRRKFRRMMKTKGGRNQQSSNDIDDDDSTSNEQDEEECLVDADSGPNQNPVRKDQKSTPQRQNRRSIDSPQGLLPLPPPLFHTGSLLTSQPILQPSLPLFSKPSPTRHLAAPKSTQLSPSLTPSSPSIHSTQIDTHNRHPKLPFSASKVD
ncbi:hypothetical protein BLNAU_21810 [Blattamonas nauphoetae]|uniref:Uncharacterized protein n=1 Tax=Blattamonas nauphoetae TaxID=2049346 RepID=A0ABQ9WY04_9EUKA|nr:hypothetical protein BLNAU_21810 [Blattamonas nauphoetae]